MRKIQSVILASVSIFATLISPELSARPALSRSQLSEQFMAVHNILNIDNADCLNGLSNATQLLGYLKGAPALDEARYLIRSDIVLCGWRNSKYDLVLENLDEAMRIEEARADVGLLGVFSALYSEKHDQMITIFRILANTPGNALGELDSQFWGRIINAASQSENPEADTLFIHQTLAQLNYSAILAFEVSDFKTSYVYTLLEQNGDRALINTLLPNVTDPRGAAKLLVDKRYDAILTSPEFARISDLQKVSDDNIKEKSAFCNQMPKNLQCIVELVNSLSLLNRADEAIVLADIAIAKIGAQRQYYSDLSEYENWIYDAKARALLAQGRFDEAFVQLRAGIVIGENGRQNVSQTINLAYYQLSANRFEDALATLQLVGTDRTDYADGLIGAIKGCANKNLGRQNVDYAAIETALYALGSDALGSLVDAQICFGRLDEAATNFNKMLDNPNKRSAALLKVSAYQLPAIRESNFEKATRENYLVLFSREEVKAKIYQYGRIIELPFNSRRF
jgi:hypothetical protein